MHLDFVYLFSNLYSSHICIKKPDLALDIIGLGVFNHDFGSVTKESPVIKVHEMNIHSRSSVMGLHLSFNAFRFFILIQ